MRMCGIIAVATNSPAKTPDISKALTSLAHRGPDGEGTWISPSGKTKLGHRRLSIVDLSEAGRQPMHNEDKSLWLVCNGEIYNYPRLRKRLEGLGHHFYSNSDNEAIIHAYEQWGEACLDYFEGMFAFAIWNTKTKQLFAAIDHVGIKPLCYSEIPGGIAIASDFRALLCLLPEKPAPNPEAVAYVMTLGYIPSPMSIWNGTCKLEPGHILNWSEERGIIIRKYWSPPTEIDYHGDYSQEKWTNLFKEVLNDHLLSDVPLGFFLSGGLDSSALAVGLNDLNSSIKALTVSFPGARLNEAPIASLVAKHLNIEHEILPLESPDINPLLDDVASAFDEPIGYSALLTMQAICSMAAHEFKAVLAGDGGDECFGGYVWHRAHIQGKLQAAQPLMSSLRRLIGTTGYSSIDRHLMRFYTKLSLTPLQKYSWQVCSRFFPEEAEQLMAPTGLNFSNEKWIRPLDKHFSASLPLLRALQRVDLMSFCSELILPKVDRASMWHSLEIRVPFLDRRIIEWGLRKPVEQSELQQENSKPILRRYLQNKVPPKVLEHPKQGFSLKNKDKYNWDDINDQIENSWWVKNRYWDKNWRKIISNKFATEQNRLWFLLMLTKWAQKWL